MSAPHKSVVALARFELSQAQVEHANAQLKAVTDWAGWLNQIELHGLSGFANKHIRDHDLVLPKEIKVSLRGLTIRHQASANARYQTLAEIDAAFTERGLSYLGLKGVALAPLIFADDAMRPMRDMDLLLPKKDIDQAADAMRELGFDLPYEQDTKYQRDMHQLPNATKKVNGFTISVELHNDGISREVPGHFYYPESTSHLQCVQWREMHFNALEDIRLTHQVSKHLEGLHAQALLKLINVVDVVGLSERILETDQWTRLQSEYPHVVNTLRCLHLYTPLPETLQAKLAPLSQPVVSGVGTIMGSMREPGTFKQRVRKLFLPSDWWMYLYYNVNPDKRLVWTKLIRHPFRMLNWLSRRLYSRALSVFE